MWQKQLHTLDHPPLLVIVEPILTRLEAGNDRMPCRRRMRIMLPPPKGAAQSELLAFRRHARFTFTLRCPSSYISRSIPSTLCGTLLPGSKASATGRSPTNWVLPSMRWATI